MKTSNLIDYEIFGAGLPVVFLHGMALNKTSNQLFFEPFLRKSNCQRIYIDLPGMGQSAPTVKATSEDVVDALAKAIKEIIGQQSFALYGHSYGGYLAQALASDFSKQVQGLFLTGPVVTADKSKRLLTTHKNVVIDRVIDGSDDHYFKDFLEMNTQISQKNWEKYQELIVPGLTAVNHQYLADLHRQYSLKEEATLRHKNYQIPFTMMVGKEDQVVGYQEQCQLAENSDAGELFLLADTGHNVTIDQPELTKLAFEHFLERMKSQQ